MKSKIFCFNGTIFRKNVTHYWPLWAIYLIYQLLNVPFYIWQQAAGRWYADDAQQRIYRIMEWAVRDMLNPISVFWFSAVMAMAVFSYLYFARNANMIHALPVTRLELYMTNYLSGLSFLVVPELITFFVTVLVCLNYDITCIQYLLYGLLCRLGMELFAYTLAVSVSMFTGQIFAVPVYYVIANYLFVGCVYILNALVSLVTFGYKGHDIWDRISQGPARLLSPLYCLVTGLSVSTVYEDVPAGTMNQRVIRGLEIGGTNLVAIYAVAAVVLAVVVYRLYAHRQLETAGDWVSIRVVKPIFRWGAALCGGTMVSVVMAEILWDVRKANVYWSIVVSMVVGGFIFFFLAEMVLHKSFRVFKRRSLAECAGCLAVGVLVLTLLELDAFGIERWLPKEDEIRAAFVYMDYPVQIDTEEIPALLAMQKEVIESEDAYLEVLRQDGGYYYTTFRYFLKDGTMFERGYPLPVTEEYLRDDTTPTSRILRLERDPESLARELLGVNYRENRYFSGSVGLYDAGGNYYEYPLRGGELDRVVEAVLADIEEMNFALYYHYSLQGGEIERYGSSIRLEYQNPRGISNYDYYRDYVEFEDSAVWADRAGYGRSAYLELGPECKNIIAALRELGITGEDGMLAEPE